MNRTKLNQKTVEKAKKLCLKHVSQQDIAKIIGVSQTTISKLEQAEYSLSAYKYLLAVDNSKKYKQKKEKETQDNIRVKMIHHIMKVQNYDWEYGPMSARAAGSLIQQWADEALRIANGE